MMRITAILNGDNEILKAGALVYKDNGKEFLLTHRFSQNDYSFPKGHLEKGETFEQAAIREVREETGCVIKIKSQLDDITYEYPESGKVRVKMFLAECLREGSGSEPNEEPFWVNRDRVENILSYENLKVFFRKSVEDFDL